MDKKIEKKATSKVKTVKKPKQKMLINRKSVYTYVILTVLILVIIVALYFLINVIVSSIKYGKYKSKMEYYQYAEMYNNKKANTMQNVTKSELVKLVICVFSNDTEVPEEYSNKALYKNQPFVKYAETLGVVLKDEITENNESSKATLKEAYRYINYLYEGETYNTESGKKLTKGMLNKLLVEIIEKYKTVYYDNESDVKIVSKKSDIPKNYEIYPYIIDSIPNEIYEIDFKIKDQNEYVNPRDMFKSDRYLYSNIDEMVTKYFNSILNVDYEKISDETFADSLYNLTVYGVSKEDVASYVKYVKDNKIKLEGSAKCLLPIIYGNGENAVVRLKINFKVINSNTNKNILFGDEYTNNNITYKGKSFEMYSDMEIGLLLNSHNKRMYIKSIAKNLVKENTDIIIEK